MRRHAHMFFTDVKYDDCCTWLELSSTWPDTAQYARRYYWRTWRTGHRLRAIPASPSGPVEMLFLPAKRWNNVLVGWAHWSATWWIRLNLQFYQLKSNSAYICNSTIPLSAAGVLECRIKLLHIKCSCDEAFRQNYLTCYYYHYKCVAESSGSSPPGRANRNP